jgi:4-carboxymuconolactone decarboxylase
MASSERYDRGWDKLKEITGEAGKQTIERLREFSPDLCDYIIEFAYGDVYARKGLDLKQRMTVTLTTLITLGDCEKELSVHIGSALRAGLTAAEVLEIAIHCIPYIGFPRVMNAVQIIRAVYEKQGILLDSEWASGSVNWEG